MSDSNSLEERLLYKFRNPAFLRRSLTHKSFANEQGDACEHSERLEFLGDAVVDLVAGHMLMVRMPNATEGQLSQARARVVSEASLADVGRGLDLGKELRLGRGEEQTGGRAKLSLLADALEAVVGAIYLEGGFEAARNTTEHLLKQSVEVAATGSVVDPKTRLQEWVQAELAMAPRYNVVAEEGPDHSKVFEVVVTVEGKDVGRGRGRSKKEAEREAAGRAIDSLVENDSGD